MSTAAVAREHLTALFDRCRGAFSSTLGIAFVTASVASFMNNIPTILIGASPSTPPRHIVSYPR